MELLTENSNRRIKFERLEALSVVDEYVITD